MSRTSLTRWDPLRAMRRWDPFSELREMQYEMDKLFDRLSREVPSTEAGFGGWMPSVESYMKGSDLIFKCELPGVDPRDVDITLDESVRQLIVKGERKTEKDMKEEDYIHKETTYGMFERRFTLPEGVKTEEVKAKFTNGILEITVPASVLSTKAKKIDIETPTMIEGEKKDVKKAA